MFPSYIFRDSFIVHPYEVFILPEHAYLLQLVLVSNDRCTEMLESQESFYPVQKMYIYPNQCSVNYYNSDIHKL